jgi:lysophospholipase L1-like esterase
MAFTSEPLPLPVAYATAWSVKRFINKQVAWSVKRFEVINKQVKNTPHRILFLGDSLTELFPRDAPRIWHEYMQPHGVLNAGVSGDRTENLLWRLQNGNLDGPPPSLVIVLIGTNDLTYNGPQRSPELVAEGIRANLLYLQERLPETLILLLGLLPRGASPDSELQHKGVAVNQLISRCTDHRSIFFADVSGALLDAQGRLTAEVSPDQLHFSEIGYAKLAPLLASMIDNLVDRR